MPVLAVINRKGGSGKSTLATQLAGCLARRGLHVMLGDVDRQQSSLAWLRRRAAQPLARDAAIVGWALDARSVLRPPAGITHVVLDTPGGLQGCELARLVMGADAIVIPVADSVFDREAALVCHAELMALPRVASGRCRVAIVGMRVGRRPKDAARLRAWAAGHGLAYAGSVRESALYPHGAEHGLTVFDAPPAKVAADLAQWRPIVDWIDAAWAAAERLEAKARTAVPVCAPSIAPQAVPRARAPVRAPQPAQAAPASASASESRGRRELARPAPRPQLGWLSTVFRGLGASA
jgi:chromosome partitioning protein